MGQALYDKGVKWNSTDVKFKDGLIGSVKKTRKVLAFAKRMHRFKTSLEKSLGQPVDQSCSDLTMQ